MPIENPYFQLVTLLHFEMLTDQFEHRLKNCRKLGF
jgi:hypothetical protein